MNFRIVTILVGFLGAIAGSARAQECPPPQADYQKPTRIYGAYGPVIACKGDKVEIVGRLTMPTSGRWALLQVPGEDLRLPWHLDISNLPQTAVSYLRDHCESDLPCVAHFHVTIIPQPPDRPPQEFDIEGHSPYVFATLDGWR